MRRLLLVLAVACGTSTKGNVFDGGDYQVGSIAFHFATGVAVTTQGLTLVLSDQPDTCQALGFVSTRTVTKLSLKVAPAADGTTRATVAAQDGPGLATGSLGQATNGVAGTSYVADSGTVAWTANGDGSVTVTAFDVGFGANGRVTVPQPFTLPGCTP